ncbi:DUF1622 domain-containing protein [Natronohydrobacter thiooxidans]|jgi:uncharacterized membrane protein|uniref:DUF1622 domain-containing protein n=1 Tax=Natronohydrobacter thiooxidans TaxID=87172 RepID=UPI0008FF45DD|nr:DUF1622 domain-containing protein [Natronohydrobacter thiooxidans]
MAQELLNSYFEIAAQLLETMGVLAIVAGTAVALVEAARNLIERMEAEKSFDLFRTRLARSILIGVEFLIAADIVGTVIIDPTMESLGVLAVIVLIRTFLSFTLEAEIEGRWPWQRGRNRHDDD